MRLTPEWYWEISYKVIILTDSFTGKLKNMHILTQNLAFKNYNFFYKIRKKYLSWICFCEVRGSYFEIFWKNTNLWKGRGQFSNDFWRSKNRSKNIERQDDKLTVSGQKSLRAIQTIRSHTFWQFFDFLWHQFLKITVLTLKNYENESEKISGTVWISYIFITSIIRAYNCKKTHITLSPQTRIILMSLDKLIVLSSKRVKGVIQNSSWNSGFFAYIVTSLKFQFDWKSFFNLIKNWWDLNPQHFRWASYVYLSKALLKKLILWSLFCFYENFPFFQMF